MRKLVVYYKNAKYKSAINHFNCKFIEIKA